MCEGAGVEATLHAFFLAACLGVVIEYRLREPQPDRGVSDWALILSRFVARRPLRVIAAVGGYCAFLGVLAFVDVECGGWRPLRLVTDLAAYARQDDVASYNLANLEAAQDASEARGACSGYSRSRQRHRYLEAAGLKHRRLSSSGVVEDLKLFYAARPRPGNVIVDKSIIDARNLERKIVSHNKFDDHCWTTYRSSGPDRYCADAAVRSAADPYFDDEGALLDVAAVTAELARSDLGAHFFDVNFGLFHQASNVSKTEMYFSITDRDDFRRWAEKYLLETLEAASTKDTRVCWLNHDINDYEVEVAVWHDGLLAIAALAFVYVAMIVHTRSPFLATVAMGQILMSVPVGLYLHRAVFGFEVTYVLNFLGLFIIAGIGCDDSFLIFDVFKHELDRGVARSLPELLAETYRKAGASMAITSLSSAASFFANAVSTLPAIRSFGVFCGTLILVNWVLDVTVFPACLVLRSRFLESSPAAVVVRAGQESEIPNFKGSFLGRFPLVSADFWTSDHLSERSRSVNAFFWSARARNTHVEATLNLSCPAQVVVEGQDDVAVASSVELVTRDSGGADLVAEDVRPDDENPLRPAPGAWGRVSVVVATPYDLGEAFAKFKSWAAVDQCFGKTLPRTVRRFHRPILVLCAGLLALAVTGAVLKTEADDEPPRFFLKSHNLGLVYDLEDDYFASTTRSASFSKRGTADVDVEAPTPAPTAPAPTPDPAPAPTPAPSARPSTAEPTRLPAPAPTHGPTLSRAPAGTAHPTKTPTVAPSAAPDPTPAPTRSLPPPSPAPVVRTPAPVATPAPTACDADAVCGGRGDCETVAGLADGARLCHCYAGFYGPTCQFDEARELDASAMLSLDVAYGLAKRPGKATSRHRGGKPRYRSFDLADRDVQEFVLETCRLAKATDSLRVRARNTVCVLEIFESEFLEPRGMALPLSPRDFERHLNTFAKSRVLLDGASIDHWVGFDCDTGDVAWLRDRFTLADREDSDVADRSKLFKKWRDFLDDRGDARPEGVSKPIMASEDEVMTSLEANIVRSSVIAALVSVACAFGCVLLLTRALFHTCLILAVVVWEMALLTAFMTAGLKWSIGIIEAISLSIFVGVSVDYVLHVDQAFRFHAAFAHLVAGEAEPTPAARLAHLAAALAEVGAPVFAAAFTTFASAVFLLFCLILPFKKLGIMICAHTALSAAAALIVLPAVLFVVPQRRVSPARPNDNGGAAFELPVVMAEEAPPAVDDAPPDDDAAAKKVADDAARAAAAAGEDPDEHKS